MLVSSSVVALGFGFFHGLRIVVGHLDERAVLDASRARR